MVKKKNIDLDGIILSEDPDSANESFPLIPLDKKHKNLQYVILGRPRRNDIYQQATQKLKTEKNSNLCINQKENVRGDACHALNRDREESSSKPWKFPEAAKLGSS
jgi:hypothetical protein